MLAGLAPAVDAAAQSVPAGASAYRLAPRSGDPSPPPAPGRTAAMARTAAQTNQWYSTLLFAAQPEPIYAQPLSARFTAVGVEVALPVKAVVPTERRDVEIHYPHANPIVVSPTAFEPGPAKLAQAGDWSIGVSMARGDDELRTGLAHGSPYVQFEVSRGDLRVALPSPGQRIDTGSDARVLALRVGGVAYALFAPSGARWEAASPAAWVARLPAGKGYLAAAALPDERPETLALLARHAYAFITDTRVAWRYDAPASQVETTFTASTRTMEGTEATPLLGLYPHHWHGNASVEGKLGPAYATVRGPVKLLAASTFGTRARYPGFVPAWPALPADAPRAADLRDLLKTDLRNARRMMLEIGDGPYWQGKGLQRIAKLLDVAEAQGDADAAKTLLELLKKRMESWFSGEDRKTYFVHDKALGTVAGHPEEYFSIAQMNDHHFHYGYWIRTAAEIALRDPAWAGKARWGAMVDLLVADIATTTRGGADFPFLRTFDAYEGHSWASGIGLGAQGNNQESSSEAVNAWAGLILWGEVTGDRALRDLGAWLYATEIQAIEHYWFDRHRLVFAPEYQAVEASMVFGGKYAHNTWWTDEPRQIKGINLLPMTTASAYLGHDAAYIRRNLGTLEADSRTWLDRGKRYGSGQGQVPKDIWQDIFMKYLALADPAAALAQWDRWGAVELGDTRSHTLHWLASLAALGTPDATVTADTPLYAVFRRADGRRSYLAYNAGQAPLAVRFSDGTSLAVAPGSLARTEGAARP